MTRSALSSEDRRTLAWLRSRRVAVLKGGWSKERPISLKTGEAVERSLRRLGVRPRSIDVKPDVIDRVARGKIGFCFIALHGAFGEDGRVQGGLDRIGVPYNGSGSLASGLAMDKIASKHLFSEAGVPTPQARTVDRSDYERDRRGASASVAALLRGGAVFVKPYDQGSAIGVSRVDRPSQLDAALRACFRVSSVALVERFVSGRELTVGILGPKTLPIIEILPVHRFYDFHSKYAPGGSRHVVPAPMPETVARRVRAVSLAAYKSLGCAGYGRVDLMLDRAGRPWVLEVNTIPGMTATSLLPDAARSAGIDFDRLVLKIIQYSLESRRQN